jgi:hypothetical protein
MLYREIIAVCSEIHTKHINTLCGQNLELLSVKPGGTYSNHRSVKNYLSQKLKRMCHFEAASVGNSTLAFRRIISSTFKVLEIDERLKMEEKRSFKTCGNAC